jgi:uncharacterized protein (DUF433 family)
MHRTHPHSCLAIGASQTIGASEADLLGYYPILRAEDLVSAWAYVRSHRDEIDQQIRENEAA